MAALRAAGSFGLLLGLALALCACFPGASGRWRAEPFELAAAQHNYRQLHQHQSHLQHQRANDWAPANLGRQLSPPTRRPPPPQHQQGWRPKMRHHRQSGARRNHHVNNNYDHRELLGPAGWPASRLASADGEQLLAGGAQHHTAPPVSASGAALSNNDNFVPLELPATGGEQAGTISQSRLTEASTLLRGAAEAVEVGGAASGNSRRQVVVGKYKRQALDLAVNRLHILEGFDEQLREFANSAASSAQQQQAGQQPGPSNTSSTDGGGAKHDDDGAASPGSEFWRQELCVLTLDFRAERGRRGDGGGSALMAAAAGSGRNKLGHRHRRQQQHNCLSSERLKRHVPPYMLNLHSQLLSESRTLADAVRLMPYQSLVMRSFRQPPLAALGPDASAALAALAASAPCPYSPAANGATVESGSSGSAGDNQPAGAAASGGGLRRPGETTRVAEAEAGGEDTDQQGDDERAPVVGAQHNGRELPEASIVVELSALGPAAQSSEEAQLELERGVALGGGDDNAGASRGSQRLQPLGPSSQSDHTGQAKAAAQRRSSGRQQQLDASNGAERPELGACNLAQRAEPAHERSELCYWFQLGEQLRLKINGSLVRARQSSAWGQERLLEAELHVFKLLPEMFDESAASGAGPFDNNEGQVGAHWIAQQQRPQQAAAPATAQSEREHAGRRQQQTRRTNYSRSSWQHLKTNLLEVSLYQILPKKNSSYAGQRTAAEVAAESAVAAAGAADFPLRLLDIRRIDLHSTGWETFYVKRAVEDWLRDASLNLGLVIKAKSMFGEPVRIGLIRFADLYDHPKQQQQHHHHHHQHNQQNAHARRTSERPAHHIRHHERQLDGHQATQSPASEPPENQFDLDHQPILVIYTTAVR